MLGHDIHNCLKLSSQNKHDDSTKVLKKAPTVPHQNRAPSKNAQKSVTFQGNLAPNKDVVSVPK